MLRLPELHVMPFQIITFQTKKKSCVINIKISPQYQDDCILHPLCHHMRQINSIAIKATLPSMIIDRWDVSHMLAKWMVNTMELGGGISKTFVTQGACFFGMISPLWKEELVGV